jgi:hypothetical protein
MSPANCRSSRIPVAEIDNSKFTVPEPVFVYTDLPNQIWLGTRT